MSPLAVCSRSDLLSCWRRAFPDGRIVQSAPPRAALPAGIGQIWVHCEGLSSAEVGERIARLTRDFPGLPVVAMSTHPDQESALRALDCGARGYCHALAAPEMLRQVAVVVANGGLWIGPELMKRMLGSVAAALQRGPGAPAAALATLSPRERAVALEVGKGATNREVATALGITERTVKAHLASIFEKLGVRDRLEMVLALRDSGRPGARDVA